MAELPVALVITYVLTELTIGLFSIFSNSVVVIAICQNDALHTSTNVLLKSLAFADMSVGLFRVPLQLLSFYGWPRNYYGCLLSRTTELALSNVSILNLVSITLERFLAIKEPFVYLRVVTIGRTKYVCVFVWILGIVVGFLPPLLGWRKQYKEVKSCYFWAVISKEFMVLYQFPVMIIVPLLLMLGIHGYIVVVVRQHIRRTSKLQRQFQQKRLSMYEDTGEGFGKKVIRDKKMFNKDVRAANMFALVNMAFATCWLPINILSSISLFCGAACPITYEIILAAIVVAHANACVNPVLYASSNSRIRHAMMNLLGWKRRNKYYTISERSFLSSKMTSTLTGSIRRTTSTLPGSTSRTTSTLPGSIRRTTSTLPGSVRRTTSTLPGSVGQMTSTSPGSIGQMTNNLPGPIGQMTSTLPGSIVQRTSTLL